MNCHRNQKHFKFHVNKFRSSMGSMGIHIKLSGTLSVRLNFSCPQDIKALRYSSPRRFCCYDFYIEGNGVRLSSLLISSRSTKADTFCFVMPGK